MKTKLQQTIESYLPPRPEYFSLLVHYYNGLFWMLFVPFRVKKNCDKQCYILKRNILQSVLCGSIHLLVLLITIRILLNTFEEWRNFDDNLVSTSFTIVAYSGSLTSSILFIKLVWFQPNRILELLNFTNLPIALIHKSITKRRFLIKIAKTFVIILIMCLMISNYYAHLKSLIQKTVQNYLGNKTISIILLTYVSTFTIITRMEMTVISVTLLYERQNVAVQLKLAGENIYTGFDIYRIMKSKIGVINTICGNRLLAYYFIVVGYYCGMPAFLLSTEFSQFPLTALLYFGLDAVGWVVAAEFNYLIQHTFSHWLEHLTKKRSYLIDNSTLSQEKACIKCNQMTKALYLIQREQQISKIMSEFKLESLAVSCRFFGVTYGFLKAMVGMLVTYAIVIYQTRVNR